MTNLTYLGHATLLIEMDGVRILTDPVLRNTVSGFLHRQIPVSTTCTEQLDAVLISHLHRDHLDIPSLRLLNRDTRLIVPKGAAALLRRHQFSNVEELQVGDQMQVGSVQVEATWATHGGDRPPFGPSAECLGFIVRGQREIYFAGDTDLFPEMTTLSENLDVALLPVWGWGPRLGTGHMNPERAAEALTLLKPRSAVPIHWGTLSPFGMHWFRPRFLVEPPHRFARHAQQLAPDVQIHVVPPGQNLDIHLSY